jgi:hypothetical protein
LAVCHRRYLLLQTHLHLHWHWAAYWLVLLLCIPAAALAVVAQGAADWCPWLPGW